MLSWSTIPRRRWRGEEPGSTSAPATATREVTHKVKEDETNDSKLLVALYGAGREAGRVCNDTA